MYALIDLISCEVVKTSENLNELNLFFTKNVKPEFKNEDPQIYDLIKTEKGYKLGAKI